MSKQTCPACYGYGHQHQVEYAGFDVDGIPFAGYEGCSSCAGRGTVDAPVTCPTCGAVVEADALAAQTMPEGALMWPQPFCRAHLLAGLRRLDAELRQPEAAGEDGDA